MTVVKLTDSNKTFYISYATSALIQFDRLCNAYLQTKIVQNHKNLKSYNDDNNLLYVLDGLLVVLSTCNREVKGSDPKLFKKMFRL